MTTRLISSEHAAAVAELGRLVRERPEDRIDPFPPPFETEVLADSGARANEDHCRPRIALEGGSPVAYGALNFSPQLKRGQLVGPVVHPDHRRKGHGTMVLRDLIGQARKNGLKRLRVVVGEANRAAQVFLETSGFKATERHTCLRLARPPRQVEMKMQGVTARRAWADDSELLYELSCRLAPRTQKQLRSLLKTSTYGIVVAFQKLKPVGFAEVDMRHGTVATLEQVEGPPSLIHKGLGNLLLLEAMRIAFNEKQTEALEVLVMGAEPERLEAYEAVGFQRTHGLLAFESKV
ncbi:MAG: GNAT family N-acetyltransferase [Planctomycetota bacterium]|jgi:ribosomal protein S18 acetylase RimI-like enzyme